MERLRIAQWGTGHGHAAGKLAALRASPRVELAGVLEPDVARREELERGGWPYQGVRWLARPEDLLGDPQIAAVASESRNHESLAQTAQIVRAGKHVWYDKPAGEDLPRWRRIVAEAGARGLHIQMGYMFRYHAGFQQIAAWARDGRLGEIYAVRAHMSTWIPDTERQIIAQHRGGILYDLAGHMIDQIVWLLGRPARVTSFLREDPRGVAGFADNTLAVLEYPRAIATIDIAAIEPPPSARRFEVYGDRGSAIMEPFEPEPQLRLCLADPAGEQRLALPAQIRQELYERELDAFVGVLLGERAPDRGAQHDLDVQETLLRATGAIPDAASGR